MNRRIIAVLAAVVLALGGGALVIAYAKSADARAIASAQPTTVWVAKKLVPTGTTLKDAQRTELIAQTQVAASAVPAGALQDINADNNAQLALSDVQPGEFLLSARFGTTPVGTKAIAVPAGMLAVSVELKDPARVGTFVTPGSRIAIYSSYKIKSLGDDPKSKAINDNDVKGTSVLLDDVQVIGMGDAPLAAPANPAADDKKTGTADSKSKSSTSEAASFLVTVAVTPEQATRLIHGINDYELYAALRGSDVKIDPNAASQRHDHLQGGDPMTILWDLDPAAADTYRFALGGEPTRLDAGPRVSRALEEDPSHTLVVIGADIPLEAACQLAEGVRVERPELGVILLRHRLEVTALAQALRSGVREVVQADDLPALADAVRRSSALTMALAGHHPSVAGREGKIVTVFSAKGGVGKTTLSTNVAAYLASTGARTVLVDLDLMFGDVAISLQLQPQNSLRDLVAMSGHLDLQGIESVVTQHEGSGLHVIAAPSDPSDAYRVPAEVDHGAAAGRPHLTTTTSSSTPRRRSPSRCWPPST